MTASSLSYLLKNLRVEEDGHNPPPNAYLSPFIEMILTL
jgi:hypothetical protein